MVVWIIKYNFMESNNNLKQTKMKNYISLYEGSYQFYQIETDKNISLDFLQMKLAKQMEYRKTNESLWGEINNNGEVKRYELNYKENKIEEIKFK